jgi:aconitate decarboxylase
MTHLTQELAEFIHQLKPQDLPNIATTTVRRGISDCMGVLFAGRNEPVVGHALSIINLCSGPRTARVLGDRGSASSADAAFINAVAAHALDYDDTGLDGHPSVVLAPVVLAEAQALGKDWQSAVTAYVAGYECWAELIGRDPDKHHGKGWHPTAVFGVVACAAASAHLRQLNLQQTAHALGIAASLASGLVANFGSMTKPLQVGWAARNGILACQLAEQGLTSSADALESPRGFLAALSPRGHANLERPCAAGHPWQIERQGLNIKRYPVCYAVHRVIDACLSLHARETIVAEQIHHIDVHIGHHQAAMLRSHFPQNELDAKFSAEFAVACALSRGHVHLDDLNDANITQPQLQSWMQLVRIHPTDAQDPDDPLFAPYDQVTIHLQNGGKLISDPVSKAQGHALRPIDEAQMVEKFLNCAQRTLSPAQAVIWWLSCTAPDDSIIHWP